jgi:hypothetical protein
VNAAFGERIIPVDRAVVDHWGRMSAQRSISTVDGLLAETAIVHRMTLVTRNEADVAGLGVKVLNPFHRHATGLWPRPMLLCVRAWPVYRQAVKIGAVAIEAPASIGPG